jgi:hypothetical protein
MLFFFPLFSLYLLAASVGLLISEIVAAIRGLIIWSPRFRGVEFFFMDYERPLLSLRRVFRVNSFFF